MTASGLHSSVFFILSVLYILSTTVHALRNAPITSLSEALFTTTAPPGRSCLSPADILATTSANLTADEIELLDYLCIPSHQENDEEVEVDAELRINDRSGIPPGTPCTPTSWCDSGQCTEICERGSVSVEPWLANAHRLQARLASTLPFCFSCLFGTHNSAISLSDGYGNLDPYYQALFKYVKWASSDFSKAILRTNNQWLSLTDQMNLGVRVVEIDTHWVGGVLRIAHCGGFHLGPLNTLVRALNTVAKIMGKHIRWDTETMGCDPSLSSIPAMTQRTLTDALQEVADWMKIEENQDEFLVVFFDDQPNLGEWGVAGKLVETILSIWDTNLIFTQDDLEAEQWIWPSAADMVAAGKRLIFISVADYGPAMAPIVFPRGSSVCGWVEPPLRKVYGAPDCVLKLRRGDEDLFTGSLVRVSSCELEYGPLNCDFVWRKGNNPVFDEANLPGVLDCGLNIPSPDLLTPARAAAAVWTWAPGHPFDSSSSFDSNGTACAVISAMDGRWRSVSCSDSSTTIRTACRRAGTPLESDDQWVLGGGEGECPNGSAFDVPRHPRENFWLTQVMRDQGVDAAWLPVQGPEWAVDGVPRFTAYAS